ncbi:MAG: UDP-N-acetylmuramate dehydrogenase [Roseiflexus sp.]|nr:UDP-N-acetylmuramate dehydrogenase [Roseiflexus sp.]MCS7290308.1 UDP-N-acetylmuramate dehydrogenase [Roseiflexus sp.]MDW8146062.1 UDP-N-acetylmuramate dehydrogenase [Roseiflexaceae bacterium]MDW8231276.1 UDP-N-acetylmuramate dehydrogenase [Roseiflexaceae bacterium]
MRCLEYEPLAPYTSWRIGGPARYFAQITSAAELVQALTWADQRDLPVFVLGGGSNVLIRDTGFNGLVLRMRAHDLRLEIRGDEARVIVESGAPMAGTARRLARQGWAGLEWAEGLPGTIGGALYGNAGCYGGDVATSLDRAWVLVDGETQEWPVERFAFSYRTSALKQIRAHGTSWRHQPVILAAAFRLHRDDLTALAQRIERTSHERRSKTPWGASCGSVFKNPPGENAGRLIEAAGLKGMRIGNAEIAARHANYIINLGGASSDDVLRLIDLARERVLAMTGIELELEIQIVG